MDDHCLILSIVYQDLPDLIELEAKLRHGDWSAKSTAYIAPDALAVNGERILAWVNAPARPVRFEAGADTGIGWMLLEFSILDRACHAQCAINLATGEQTRPSGIQRISVELPTELGLIENFAKECISLGWEFKGRAVLRGLRG